MHAAVLAAQRHVHGGRWVVQVGILANWACIEGCEETPQGGPLSLLLASVLLDEVDRALERRGLRFVRHPDDCNVYLRSPAGADGCCRGCTAAMRSWR